MARGTPVPGIKLTPGTINNPQAFSGPEGICCAKGMSLLDYFAGQAMVAYCIEFPNVDPDKRASWCYDDAVKMLVERDKRMKAEETVRKENES